MAAIDTGFSDIMIAVLKQLRPDLIKGLTLDEEFFAYLISMNVFQTTDYIRAEKVQFSQARKLLDDLQRRPGADFWKFIRILFRTQQGHLGKLILHEYEQRGGTNIPQDIHELRQDYLQEHVFEDEPPPPNQVQQIHEQCPNQLPLPQQQPHDHQPQPADQGPQIMDVDAPGDAQNRNQTLSGNLLTHDSQSHLGAAVSPALLDVEQTDAKQLQPSLQHRDNPHVTFATKYFRKRQEDPESVFRMETNPRGLLLLIDNEFFEHLPNRDGTQQDRRILCDVFRNKLGFECMLHQDCTAEMMMQVLTDFSQNQTLQQVDAMVVAIFSHGSQGDKIFGTDGRMENRRPAEGTYITVVKLSSLFSSSNCPAMQGKPKLFIIQACRGGLEDRVAQPFGRDIVLENPSDMPNFVDRYFLFATVENYVAYRGRFVQLLAEVLHQHADTEHIKDIATQLHNKMKTVKVGENTFTISEERGNLTKKWYLNPPTTHIC